MNISVQCQASPGLIQGCLGFNGGSVAFAQQKHTRKGPRLVVWWIFLGFPYSFSTGRSKIQCKRFGLMRRIEECWFPHRHSVCKPRNAHVESQMLLNVKHHRWLVLDSELSLGLLLHTCTRIQFGSLTS